MRRRHNLNNMNDLFLSVANGNLRGLQQYLGNGGNPNLKDTANTNLFHKAVLENNIEKVMALVEGGCHLDDADGDGRTAVYMAIGDGHHDILKLLLDVGSNVNTVAFQHSTPLIKAVDRKDKVGVEMLLTLAPGCDINLENYFFQTALSHAIVSKNLEICETLLKHGASTKCLYKKGLKIEIARVLCSDLKMTELLLKYTKTISFHHYLLWGACILKAYEMAEYVLLHFEDPFQLKGLGFINRHEEIDIWERLAKVVIKNYKLATKCCSDNKLLMLMLDFCDNDNYNQRQRSLCKQKAIVLIRRLIHYGLVIHPQTTLKPCQYECECRKCIFTALYERDSVTSLKGQCVSIIRQNMRGEGYFKSELVESLPVPRRLQSYISMSDW